MLLASHATVLLLIFAALILPAYPAWAWLPLVVMLISVPGVLASRTYTYRWLMMLLALPVALGLMELIANPALRLWSAALVFFSCTLFFCLALSLRTSG
ncbi:MAG: DUF2069 domain-containing protein [Proteobacteria bacterium]|nr:DUF2069 domain-containing protein [Pseudomonadota bacterium]